MKRRTTRGIFASVVAMWIVALWGLNVGAVENRFDASDVQNCITDDTGELPTPLACPSPEETSASPSASGSKTATPTTRPSSASPTGSSTASPKGSSTASPTQSSSPTPTPSPSRTEPADKTYNSSVSIKYRGQAFNGHVGSRSKRCQGRRDVTVKKVKRGRDAKATQVQTGRGGDWRARSQNAEGKYYAKVKATAFTARDGSTINCRGARSRAISV